MSDDTATLPGYAFLSFVLDALCEDKDQLSIEAKKDELGILLTIRVSERDMGKLIGKGGQTVKALRTLLRIIGGNASERVNLKILEPDSAVSTA
ncbi:MAG: KH domain-containing protein [Candidatus Peribacter sp.]|nr:KH domain-containing protein [Candidatus Peribacter sp.]